GRRGAGRLLGGRGRRGGRRDLGERRWRGLGGGVGRGAALALEPDDVLALRALDVEGPVRDLCVVDGDALRAVGTAGLHLLTSRSGLRRRRTGPRARGPAAAKVWAPARPRSCATPSWLPLPCPGCRDAGPGSSGSWHRTNRSRGPGRLR